MISPDTFQVAREKFFILSKVPIVILFLSNYMLYKPQKKCLTVIQVVLAIITHSGGIALTGIYIYGVLTAVSCQLFLSYWLIK